MAASKVDTTPIQKAASVYTVLNVVLESGERLPCLVERSTWIPVRVATRWAVRYRRYRVQSSTLEHNLRALGRVYDWAKVVHGFDLDDHLTSGGVLGARQVESLVLYFRTRGRDSETVVGTDPGALDHEISVVENFLSWALDSDNRGGARTRTLEELAAQRAHLQQLCQSLRTGARPSARIQPLSEQELVLIRRVLSPKQESGQEWAFPEQVFYRHARLRNWLMVETALELGLRRGELLKLRLDSLPRGSEDGLRVLRRPDDPHDSRGREPAVKSAERAVPISRFLVSIIRAYLTLPTPLGRPAGKTPYLFVTRKGEPLSVKASDDIMKPIARHTGVTPLSWHRLRHTWAERMAELLAEQANGMDKLMYLGGWTNPQSPKRYIQNAIARQAGEAMRNYHRSLYRGGIVASWRQRFDLRTTWHTRPICPPFQHGSDRLTGSWLRRRRTAGRCMCPQDGGRTITIRWERLRGVHQECCYTPRAEHLVRLYLADRLTRKKASTIHNDFSTFLYFEAWLRTNARVRRFNWTDLNERLARAFLAYGLDHTAEKGNRFSRLRTFYEWGVARQHSDFDTHVLRLLQAIPAVGNAKGHHVRFRHPTKGPFSPDELLLIRNAIDTGNGSEKDRALVMLHLELGHNPSATARLKNSDLIRYEAAMLIRYHLDVPRVKKRTAHRETKRRPISNKLGVLLESLQAGGSGDPLIHWLPRISPDSSITCALRRFARSAGLVSPRTLKPLVANARRFRSSIATHMAEEGASLFHIAEILDHTDTQNVRVYVETVSSIADPVAKATDAALAPLVRRFQGKIVDSSDTRVFDGLPNQVIPAVAPHLGIVHLNVGGVGMCGRDARKDGLCRLLPPVSCYLCPSFAALRDGPHQEMLDSIETFLRESEATADRRIQMQLDEVRVAIQQVIRQVKEPEA